MFRNHWQDFYKHYISVNLPLRCLSSVSGARPLFLSVLMTYISALQNGIDHGKLKQYLFNTNVRRKWVKYSFLLPTTYPSVLAKPVTEVRILLILLRFYFLCKVKLS